MSEANSSEGYYWQKIASYQVFYLLTGSWKKISPPPPNCVKFCFHNKGQAPFVQDKLRNLTDVIGGNLWNNFCQGETL